MGRCAACPELLSCVSAHLLLATDVAVHQRQVLPPVQEGAVGVHHEAAVAGGQALWLGNLLGQPVMLDPAAVHIVDTADNSKQQLALLLQSLQADPFWVCPEQL